MYLNIDEFEEQLKIYHKILLAPEGITILSERYFSEAVIDKILIILTKPHDFTNKNIFTEEIPLKAAEKLAKLYWTYEFSDSFLVLTKDRPMNATIFNFVKTGLLTYEEAWRSLLY